ncbi:MAG: diguanylate cyclase [Rhodocyclaceae bacterium]|nr:diguanylate cyclase [Rhodocyclaceae bacterium]
MPAPSSSQSLAEPLLVAGAALVAGLVAELVLGGRAPWPLGEACGALGGGLAALFLARRRRAAAERLESLVSSLPPVPLAELERGLDTRTADLSARLEAALRSEREMRLVANTVHGLEVLFSPERRLTWVSPSVEEIAGYSTSECLAADDPIGLLVHQTDRAYCHQQAGHAFEDHETTSFEVRLEHRSGGVIWIACHWTPVMDDRGRLSAVRMSGEPIQSRKEAELRLLESVAEMRRARSLSEHYLLRTKDERQRLSAVLDAIRTGIVLMDTEQRVLYLNQAFMQMWGFGQDENLFGMRDVVLFGRCESQMESPEQFRMHANEVLDAGHGSAEYEFRLKDSRVITDSSVVVTREGSDITIGRVWIFEDVTDIRRSAEILQNQAERDALTGLYNRRRFDEEMERAIAESERRNRQTGLLVFDLDGFKPVNDTFGHQAGDRVLVTLAEAISRVVRRHEMLFRFGGDEFAILVPDSEDSHLQELARRVVDCVAGTEFEFDGRKVSLTTSVGLACFPLDASDVRGLVAAADSAMYRAKSGGKNQWAMSEPHGG